MNHRRLTMAGMVSEKYEPNYHACQGDRHNKTQGKSSQRLLLRANF